MRDYQVNALAEHDLFKLLKGNPHSISLLACSRANPIEKVTLAKIYEMAKQNNWQSISQGDDNNLSLQISAETTISLLQSTLPDALTFLYFISMLPAGA